MSDPTTPKDEASADTAELPAVTEDIASTGNAKRAEDANGTTARPTTGTPTADTTTAKTTTGDTAVDDASGKTAGAKAGAGATGATGSSAIASNATGSSATGSSASGSGASGKAGAAGAKTGGGKKKRSRFLRGPWVTVAGAVVLLLVLAALGYVWGLGPINRLNTMRGINPPAKLAGLDRITDQEIRGQLQLDQTRDALSRINDGKKATVEAYGSLDGDRLYVIIAVRGNVNIDQVVADSGASPDKIKKVGNATCLESSGNLPTQCYRTSNVLTVIAQSANENVSVDQVAPVAQEAFKAMK